MDCQLQCQCGHVRGQLLKVTPHTTNRAVCYCKFCRSYLKYLQQDQALLDEWGGTDIIQVSPRAIKIEHGKDNIRAIKLTEKGAWRFFAGCCNTPLVNTAPNLAIPFAGLNPACVVELRDAQRRETIVGPIRFRVNGSGELFSQLDKTGRWTRIRTLMRIARLMLVMKLRGDAKQSPFRQANGEPIVQPERVRMAIE